MWEGGHGQIVCRCFVPVPTEALNEDGGRRAAGCRFCVLLPCPACTDRAQITGFENVCWRETGGSAPGSLLYGVWGFFSCKKLEEDRWSSGTSSHLLRGFTDAAPVAERRRQEGFRRGLRHKAAATAGLKVEQEPDRE